jgi:hypothetical protein
MKRIFAAVLVLTIVTFFTGCLSPGGPPATPGTSPTAGSGTTVAAPSTGTIRVLVTDAPGEVSSVNISVSRVEVHKAGSDGEPGAWTSLNVTEQDQPFNLLALQNGLTMTLAEGFQVESGNYTQLRMTVFSVLVNTEDGPAEGYPARVPSNILKFVRPFSLEGGGAISLLVDFDVAKSVVFTGGPKGDGVRVIFKPVVKLSIQGEQQTTQGEPVTEEEPAPGDETTTTPLAEPTAVFEPVSGPVETLVTVNGTDWATEETIASVTVGGEPVVDPALQVSTTGNLTGSITIPAGLAPGACDIVIEGDTSGSQTFPEAFTVTATATFELDSELSTQLNVRGTGWAASDSIISVELNGEPVTYDLQIDASGNLTGNITLPDGLAGPCDITIEGDASGSQSFPDAFTAT